MVTDRCSTLGLLFILYGEYGGHCNDGSYVHGQEATFGLYKVTFLLLALLDISSHWCQMFSTASLQIHHKSSEGNTNRFILVRWYYSNYAFFGYCCVSAELTYVLLYVRKHMHHVMMKDDNKDSSELWIRLLVQYLLQTVLPGCIMKQIVNVFQLTSACHAVASNDASERTRVKVA